jgi:hypothetical protein
MTTKKNVKNNVNFWMFKAPMQLKIELQKIRLERIKKGKDTQMKSFNRLGLAIARHPQLLKDLMVADLPEGKNEK